MENVTEGKGKRNSSDVDMLCAACDAVKAALRSGSCVMSHEQQMAFMELARIACSPAVQRCYVYDVCRRWNVSDRTLRNWVAAGVMPEGHKVAHDTRVFWYDYELDAAEADLIAYGYLKRRTRPLKHVAKTIMHYIMGKTE